MNYLKVLIIAASILIIPQTTYAQSFSISLNPEKHEIISRPGKTITLPYSLANLGDPQLLTFNVYSLKVVDTFGNSELLPYKQGSNTPQFAVINSAMELGKPFLMNGKSTVLFDVEITIPESAENKDYYVTFVAESEGMKSSEGTSSIQIDGGIGSHILLTVTDSGQINQTAQIAQFEIPNEPSITIRGEKYSLIDSYNPIPFILTIVNTGNNYIKTTGIIQSGSELPLKLPETIILSNSQREISSSRQLTKLSSSHIFGIEKITATIKVGESQVLYANANIIVLPVKIIVITGLLFITAFSVSIFIKKQKKKSII